jgi:hypothetical protein
MEEKTMEDKDIYGYWLDIWIKDVQWRNSNKK